MERDPPAEPAPHLPGTRLSLRASLFHDRTSTAEDSAARGLGRRGKPSVEVPTAKANAPTSRASASGRPKAGAKRASAPTTRLSGTASRMGSSSGGSGRKRGAKSRSQRELVFIDASAGGRHGALGKLVEMRPTLALADFLDEFVSIYVCRGGAEGPGEGRDAAQASVVATLSTHTSRRKRLVSELSQKTLLAQKQSSVGSTTQFARQLGASVMSEAEFKTYLTTLPEAHTTSLVESVAKEAASQQTTAGNSRSARWDKLKVLRRSDVVRVGVKDGDGIFHDRERGFTKRRLEACRLHFDAPSGISPFLPREDWPKATAQGVTSDDASRGSKSKEEDEEDGDDEDEREGKGGRGEEEVEEAEGKPSATLPLPSTSESRGKREGQAKAPPRPERMGGYCECCKLHYTETMRQHIESLAHQAYMRDVSNFRELDAFISGLDAQLESASPVQTPMKSPPASNAQGEAGTETGAETTKMDATEVKPHPGAQPSRRGSIPRAAKDRAVALQVDNADAARSRRRSRSGGGARNAMPPRSTATAEAVGMSGSPRRTSRSGEEAARPRTTKASAAELVLENAQEPSATPSRQKHGTPRSRKRPKSARGAEDLEDSANAALGTAPSSSGSSPPTSSAEKRYKYLPRASKDRTLAVALAEEPGFASSRGASSSQRRLSEPVSVPAKQSRGGGKRALGARATDGGSTDRVDERGGCGLHHRRKGNGRGTMGEEGAEKGNGRGGSSSSSSVGLKSRKRRRATL